MGELVSQSLEVLAATELDNRVVMKLFRDNHRVLDNEASRAVETLEAKGVTDYEAYRTLVNGRTTRRAYETGNLAEGMIDLGPAAVFAKEIKPLELILDDMIDEAVASADRVASARVSADVRPASRDAAGAIKSLGGSP